MKLALRMLTFFVFFLLLGTATFVDAVNIDGTKHNLTATGPGATKTTDSTISLCGFCHIAHGGNPQASYPLWARELPQAVTYEVYGSSGAGR